MDINITATSVEEFQEIERVLSVIAENITEQISSAKKSLVGIECVVSKLVDNQVIIPNNVTQIKYFDDFIGIYAGDLFIKIEGQNDNKSIGFVFVNNNGNLDY